MLNVIPFVDILFMLIIFFILAARFVAPDEFSVEVPQPVEHARSIASDEGITTITVMPSATGGIDCAIGSERLPAIDKGEMVARLSSAIDKRLEFFPPQKRIVALRIDKSIPYKDVQYVLAAVARSNAAAVRLAAIREKL